jgi:hypothetical protein
LYGAAWATLVAYSPAEITELQQIPAILQGGTDWGGSNEHAAYMSGSILFGILGALQWGLVVSADSWRAGRAAVFGTPLVSVSLWVWWLGISVSALISAYRPPTLQASSQEIARTYFFCERVQSVLFVLAMYITCVSWTLLVRRVLFRTRYAATALAPIPVIFFIWLGWTGITPKTGQLVQAGEIPSCRPQSERHRALLRIHFYCMRCRSSDEQVWKQMGHRGMARFQPGARPRPHSQLRAALRTGARFLFSTPKVCATNAGG